MKPSLNDRVIPPDINNNANNVTNIAGNQPNITYDVNTSANSANRPGILSARTRIFIGIVLIYTIAIAKNNINIIFGNIYFY
jgi:hypothetical protein